MRIAYWNYAQDTYSIIDTKSIPLVTTLDTYHDGNAIFVNAPYQSLIQEIDSESEELFITFENVDGMWLLTTFTDGQTFSALYQFEDYYDADDEFESDTIEIRHDILYFADFDINELYNCIYEYYSVLYK